MVPFFWAIFFFFFFGLTLEQPIPTDRILLVPVSNVLWIPSDPLKLPLEGPMVWIRILVRVVDEDQAMLLLADETEGATSMVRYHN